MKLTRTIDAIVMVASVILFQLMIVSTGNSSVVNMTLASKVQFPIPENNLQIALHNGMGFFLGGNNVCFLMH